LGAIRDVSNFSYVDIDVCQQTCELNAKVMFVESRKLDYNIMGRVTNMNEADILVGRTKAILAKTLCYV
jgi:hypothetical protein